MCMGARIVAPETALMLLDRWLECEFSGGGSLPKVEKINEIDQKYR